MGNLPSAFRVCINFVSWGPVKDFDGADRKVPAQTAPLRFVPLLSNPNVFLAGTPEIGTMAVATQSLAEKLALVGGAASLALCSGTIAEAAIIACPNVPITPPSSAGNLNLDVDGDGTSDFQLRNMLGSAWVAELNGGRFVAATTRTADGLAKLSSGFVVGPTMAGYKFFASPQTAISITSSSGIATDALSQGWTMGQTGLFGFKFTSGANTYYGWGEMVLDPGTSLTVGHGYTITRMYYEDSGSGITVGDTGGSIPEPSTCALALLAAGGVAAYRARRKVASA